jgi:hypothetical protein
MSRTVYVGGHAELDGSARRGRLRFPIDRLCTHGVVVGMTGSGKTGLLLVMIEEAVRNGVPVVVLDIKGDLANLALGCDGPESIAGYLSDHRASERESASIALHERRMTALELWGLSSRDALALDRSLALRLFTPGSDAGESLHLLSALELPNARWETHPIEARESLAAAISMVLRVLDRDDDPARSREHVLLSVLAERHLRAGRGATLDLLMADLREPPIETVGALALDEFVSVNERATLAAALNALFASPTFAAWRTGAPLDVGQWLAPREDGRTPVALVSVAHLDEAPRMHVLAMVLEEALSWTRAQPGTDKLRALFVVDEVFGLVPPRPAEPPTRKPIVSLMKQGRAFGVGLVLATQNPMDLDYRTLSNAGLWAIGRLQTDADRARVIEAMTGAKQPRSRKQASPLGDTVKDLQSRWFLWHDARESTGPALARVRDTLSWLRGPMTPDDLRRRMR